ncbi:TetR/AcrR family transcriptional regulator [Nocardioides panacis]|uniref:TetR/AcrR family transcriptional regulator n=1 Tax=Nocardioides panacis TaxID=2849501 RepID=A0A975SZ90_9ACTN|nr:TetR/AcrR family transcriptional regulator [Nocardioides panacis]QWZ08710.1 TetR/AcrR family transcriptional regulator [Nocardioides panacis]
MGRARPRDSGRASPAPPAESSGAATRRRILDAAEDLIAQDGFDATPTADIAARAEVPKGLLFYYFPKKVDLLRSLLAERLPSSPLFASGDVVLRGDIAGSLIRLAHKLTLRRSQSPVLGSILFREAGTHPEVGHHLRTVHDELVALTERVLEEAASVPLNRPRRRQAADTYVAVLLHDANSHRYGGPRPDLTAAATMISTSLTSGHGDVADG